MIVSPGSILDTDISRNIGAKRTATRAYTRAVKALSITNNSVTKDDLGHAKEYSIAVEVASLVPKISRKIVTASYADIVRQFNNINNKLDNMEVILSNSSATDNADTIIPPKNIDNDDEIASLPRTIAQLVTIDDPALALCEAFYGLEAPNGATLQARRRALRRKYGVVMVTQPVTGRQLMAL